jgi:DNA modification methylase
MKINIIYKGYSEITPYEGNPKAHPEEQLKKLAESIKKFGFNSPIIVDNNNVIVCGHARYLALGMVGGYDKVPCIIVDTLTPAELKAYRIADNKITMLGYWDSNLLAQELKDISLDEDFSDIEICGFEQIELDQLLDYKADLIDEINPISNTESEGDMLEEEPAVSQLGDVWVFGGKHKLLCGDSLIEDNYKLLFTDGEKASLCCSDPPYNMKMSDIGRGVSLKKHKFFSGSGELDDKGFIEFLHIFFENNKKYSIDNALFYYFINWQKNIFMSKASEMSNFILKNICVWVKNHFGLGWLYRHQHEFIHVYAKEGLKGGYENDILGINGSVRSNVWEYPIANIIDKRDHPTIKPINMIIDIILYSTKNNDIVLDSFMGSGTTIRACQACNRIGYGIEYEPVYVDLTIRRFRKLYSDIPIILQQTGETYEEVKLARGKDE